MRLGITLNQRMFERAKPALAILSLATTWCLPGRLFRQRSHQ
jgi:hypothetical protein